MVGTPSLFLDQTEAQRDEKNIFWDRPPLILESGYAPANRLCGSLLTTLPDIKIIDYVTHLEFRACSLMAQVLLPEKRNWIFPSWPGTVGHETALKEVLYLP